MTRAQRRIAEKFSERFKGVDATIQIVNDDSTITMAQTRDSRLALAVRAATEDLAYHDTPFAFMVDDMMVTIISRKLESPNKHRFHWTVQHGDSANWEKDIQKAYLDMVRVASWDDAAELGRRPALPSGPMNLQIVRLVMSNREFMKDDSNMPGAGKGLQDALVRLGFLKDDRREYLITGPQPVMQDVSATDCYVTVFFFWPF